MDIGPVQRGREGHRRALAVDATSRLDVVPEVDGKVGVHRPLTLKRTERQPSAAEPARRDVTRGNTAPVLKYNF